MSTFITQEDLVRRGFTKDETCPDSVNRYEKTDKRIRGCGRLWISVTMTDDGSKSKYGVCLFFEAHNAIDPRANPQVIRKRKWEGPVTAEDLDAIMDYNADQPSFVKQFPATPENK